MKRIITAALLATAAYQPVMAAEDFADQAYDEQPVEADNDCDSGACKI